LPFRYKYILVFTEISCLRDEFFKDPFARRSGMCFSLFKWVVNDKGVDAVNKHIWARLMFDEESAPALHGRK